MPDQWDPRVYRQRAEAWRQRAAVEEEDEQRHAACLAIADGYDKLASRLEIEEASPPNRAMTDDLPTARTTLATRYLRVLVFCKSCRHSADADLQAIIDAGRGDVPLTQLRFRCARCGTGNTDFVVTAKAGV